MEATGAAEVIGVSQDVIKKLHDTASVLTTERKKKGKLVPEDLTQPDEIRSFRVSASHSVLKSLFITIK